MSARAGRAASAMSSAMLWRMGLCRLRCPAASWRVVSRNDSCLTLAVLLHTCDCGARREDWMPTARVQQRVWPSEVVSQGELVCQCDASTASLGLQS